MLLIAGVTIPTLLQAVRTQLATNSGITGTRLLLAAESALDYNFSELEKNAVYAVRNEIDFVWNPSDRSYEWSSPRPLQLVGDAFSQSFHLKLQYIGDAGPVEFDDRQNPMQSFDRIKVTATASAAHRTRQVVAWYAFRFGFHGAIVSDNVPTTSGGNPKTMAKKGHIVFDGSGNIGEHIVFGDLHSNGEIVYFEKNSPTPLTTENASSQLQAFEGEIKANLGGTDQQIPDFTDASSQKQLFDFARFEAAAVRGAGAIYNGLDEFEQALRNSQDSGEPLEGIIVVKIDPGIEGNSPKISGVPIRVTGTLLFDFADGTSGDYKVVIDRDVSVRINAADLSDVDFTDKSTYTSGYPGKYLDATKQPQKVDISFDGFENFRQDDDLPAVMFNNGIVDFHGEVNVCGLVYGPAFIEIENKNANVMYINGALFGGGGVYLQAHGSGDGVIAIHHDPNTTDRLALFDNTAALLERIGYTIVR